MKYILLDSKNNIIRITINRPSVSNALNIQLIEELISSLEKLRQQEHIRLLIIQSSGKNFCAGADLQWMQNLINAPESEHIKDSQKLINLLEAINNFPTPTLCITKGAVYGGGIGIIAACDIVIAEQNSIFCFSEARLGLIPAVISPYVVKAIGARQAKKLFLTAETFTPDQAYQFGLIHHFSNKENLQKLEQTIIENILSCAPIASKMIKKLFLKQDLTQKKSSLMHTLTHLIAKIRVSDEAQHGMKSFLEKRAPYWNE